MGALSNALANAASSLVGSVGQNVGGLITGTNPLTQPQIAQIFNTNIPGTPLVSTRDYFLFQLNSWVTAFPLMSQWIAVIESYPAALRSDILRGLERTTGSRLGFDINLAKTILTSYPFQRVTGCIFANNVTLPEESITIKTATLENNRGFVPGVVAGDRRSYADKPLALSFFETSTSFLDFVIRPWVILAGHYGFVARRGDTNRSKSIFNVKTNITLLHFNRTYQNVSQIPRRCFVFIIAFQYLLPHKIMAMKSQAQLRVSSQIGLTPITPLKIICICHYQTLLQHGNKVEVHRFHL